MPSEPIRSKPRREYCTLRDGRHLSYLVQQPHLTNNNDASSSLPHILMFHGMFGTASDVVLQSPPEKYIWICVDRPGYGHSSTIPRDGRYCYQQFATDIGELANHLQLAQFYVAGHSSGGPCALACGAHLGEHRVLGIAAIASDAEYVVKGAPQEGTYEKCCLRCCLPCCIVGLSFGGMCGPCSRRLHGYRVDHVLEHEAYDFRMQSIRQPTLLAYGANDTWAKPHSEFIKEQMEQAELMVIPDANHASVIQKVYIDTIVAKLLSMTEKTSNVD